MVSLYDGTNGVMCGLAGMLLLEGPEHGMYHTIYKVEFWERHLQQLLDILLLSYTLYVKIGCFLLLSCLISFVGKEVSTLSCLKMPEKKVLRRIYGYRVKRQSELCNEELHSLYTLASVVRLVKSREF